MAAATRFRQKELRGYNEHYHKGQTTALTPRPAARRALSEMDLPFGASHFLGMGLANMYPASVSVVD
jgi:hypothetical protein